MFDPKNELKITKSVYKSSHLGRTGDDCLLVDGVLAPQGGEQHQERVHQVRPHWPGHNKPLKIIYTTKVFGSDPEPPGSKTIWSQVSGSDSGYFSSHQTKKYISKNY